MTFEQFLRDKHFDNYHGTDDDMSDSFDKWLTDLQADDFIKYGDTYAMEFLKEHGNKIIEITKETKATFFVKDENVQIPIKEALYELKAEICDNIGLYLFKIINANNKLKE